MCFIFTAVPTAFFLFFFNDTATTEIYTLSLHDALPISPLRTWWPGLVWLVGIVSVFGPTALARIAFLLCWKLRQRVRSEEHTSELQSQFHLVCRLLLEKKNIYSIRYMLNLYLRITFQIH